jgi:hypothetical protein
MTDSPTARPEPGAVIAFSDLELASNAVNMSCASLDCFPNRSHRGVTADRLGAGSRSGRGTPNPIFVLANVFDSAGLETDPAVDGVLFNNLFVSDSLQRSFVFVTNHARNVVGSEITVRNTEANGCGAGAVVPFEKESHFAKYGGNVNMTIAHCVLAKKMDDEISSFSTRRAVSWWWDSEHSGSADGLINFCREHTNIVTRVMLCCGVFTCVAADWSNASAPRGTCTNNNGTGGTVTGTLSPKCQQAIPVLAKLGIQAELWLGEDDSITSAKYMFAHLNETAEAVLAIAKEYPGQLTGIHFDLESEAPFYDQDRADYAQFLKGMTLALHNAPHRPLRFSADMECQSPSADKMLSNCSAVASSADRLYSMYTYNSADYYEWVHQQLAPALATVPLDTLGVGLGCWVDPGLNHTWNLTPEAAKDRVCKLMNESVQEIGMFVLSQAVKGKPQLTFPEPFWIAPLERFMQGESCNAKVPTPTKCPATTVGKPDGPNAWHQGGYVSDWNCCTSGANRGAGHSCNATCAQAECAATPGMHWRPLNIVYTCCWDNRTDIALKIDDSPADFTGFERDIFTPWVAQFKSGPGVGDYSYFPGHPTSVYGSADTLMSRYILGQLNLTSAEADSWAATINSFQDAATGLYLAQDFEPHHGPPVLHTQDHEHTTAFALAALTLIARKPAHPLALMLQLQANQTAWLPWLANTLPNPSKRPADRGRPLPSWDHRSAGVYASLSMAGALDPAFADFFFGWLDQNADEATGYACASSMPYRGAPQVGSLHN